MISILTFALLNTAILASASTNCNTALPSDIVFLVDESGSVNGNLNYTNFTNFQRQMDFIATFISGFKLGKNGAQIGLVTFSTDLKVEFYLNQYHDLKTLQDKTRQVGYTHPGLTFTNLGLDFVREKMFTPHRGDRPNAANVIIVVTDGESNIPMLTAASASQVHAANISVFTIGIGNKTNKQELRTIASDPKNVMTVNDFKDLQGIRGQLQKGTCKVIKAQPTTPGPSTTTTRATTTTSKPTTRKPKPTTRKPNPTTTTAPKPTTRKAKPKTTTTPKPTTRKPKPTTTTAPKPTTRKPKPTTTTTPKPTTRKPKPTTTTAPKPITRKPKPTTTTTPKPTTRKAKPTTTTTQKPTTRKPTLRLTTTTTPKPTTRKPKPTTTTTTPKPTTTTTTPKHTTTTTQKPTTTSSKPTITTLKPTTTMMPKTTSRKRKTTTQKPKTSTRAPKSTKPGLLKSTSFVNGSTSITQRFTNSKSGTAEGNNTNTGELVTELVLPGWFSYLEVGIITSVAILTLGSATCCCHKFCCAGSRKRDDDDDDDQKKYAWKKDFREPIKRPTSVSI